MALPLQLKYIISAIIFFAAGIAAIITEESLLLAIPFLFVLGGPLYKVVVHKTEWIFFILIALLPLSTEINITPSLGLDLPDEFLMILLTAVFVLKVSFSPSTLNAGFINHPLFLLLLLHLTWIVVSTIFSTDPALSLKFLLAKTWFIIPFVILPCYFLNTRKSLRLLPCLLVIPMGFVVVQALIRHAFFDFSFESVKEIYSPFFRNHVNFSGMLVCLMAVLFTTYKLTPHNNRYRKLLRIGLFIGFAGAVLAYSRGAWLALITGTIAYRLIQNKLIGYALIIATAITLAVGAWLLIDHTYLHFAHDYNSTIFHKDFNEHLEATVQFKDVSNAERFYRWIAGINMIAEKPFTGFGPNNFYNNYQSYTETPFKTWVSNNPEHSSVHNYFILTTIEQGIPGLVFFCILYFGMILFSQKLYHSLSDNFYRQIALTAGVILTMIGALIFMSDLIETDKIGSLFWLCLGVLIVISKQTKNVGGKIISPGEDQYAFQ